MVGRKPHVCKPCLKVYIVPTMLTELFYPLQFDYTPLHWAAHRGHGTCMKHLLSTPGIDVNMKDVVSWYSCRMGRVGGGVL